MAEKACHGFGSTTQVGLTQAVTASRKNWSTWIQAEAQKIKAQARKLCDRLPAMHATQQQLAAALPEFRPYATMTEEDIADCRKDSRVAKHS